MALDLRDTAGIVLALGAGDADNTDVAIRGFVAPAAATYYARVTGEAGRPYSLVITRGAEFDREPNDTPSEAQDISIAGQVLGAVGFVPAITTETEPNDDGLVGGSISDLPFANDWSGSLSAIGGNQYRAVLTGTISAGSDQDWDFFKVFTSPGDRLEVALDGVSLGDPYLRLFDNTGRQLAYDDDSGPGLNSLLVYTGFTYAGDYYIVADSFGSYIGTYRLTATLTTPNLIRSSDSPDFFIFQANAGDSLVLATTTPGDGPGEPLNTLDPIIELYDSAGILVASDDNGAADGHNALVEYAVPAGGTGIYRVAVRSARESGAYTLRVTGATGGIGPGPSLVATSPADGEPLADPPTALVLTLSEALRVDSVEPGDLVIDGGATVTG